MIQHWLNRERLTNYPRILLALYLISAVLMVATSHQGLDAFKKPLGHDFITYWAASQLALSGNAVGAYDLLTIVHVEWALVPGFKTLNPWVYPPTYLLLVMPLALLPYVWAFAAFMGLTFAAFWIVLRRIEARPGSLLLLLAFPGVYVNLVEGQNAFLTCALIGGALLWLQTRPLAAGFLIGLLTIKPHLGLLLPLVLIAGRHWRALLAAALTAVLFLALSLAVLSTETLTAFTTALHNFPGLLLQQEKLPAKMPSLFAAARLLGMPVTLAAIIHAAIAMPVAIAATWVWARCRDAALCSAILVVGSLLVSPYVFNYDLVWLALPITWLAGLGMRDGWLPWEREALAAAWLLPLFDAPLAAVTRLQLGPVVTLLLFAVLLRRAVRVIRTGTPMTAPPAALHFF